MSRDITIPTMIIFLNEMYEKEQRLRAQWVTKNQQQLELAATLQRKPTNYFESDVVTHNIIGGLATISRDHKVAGFNRRKVPLRDAKSMPGIKNLKHNHSIINQGFGDPKKDPRLARPDTDLSIDPVMRPIEPEVKNILYKAMHGREQYLKQRAMKSPEIKYYFPECSSWDYGWRLADSGSQPMSEYGRHYILDRTFHSRVGLQAGLKQYMSGSSIDKVEKCGLI